MLKSLIYGQAPVVRKIKRLGHMTHDPEAKKKPRLIQPKKPNEVKRRNQLMIPTDINVVLLQQLHDCENLVIQKDAIIKEQKMNLLRKTSKLTAQRKKNESKMLQLKQSAVHQIDIMPKIPDPEQYQIHNDQANFDAEGAKMFQLKQSAVHQIDIMPKILDPEQYQSRNDHQTNFDAEGVISDLQQLGENFKFNNG